MESVRTQASLDKAANTISGAEKQVAHAIARAAEAAYRTPEPPRFPTAPDALRGIGQ